MRAQTTRAATLGTTFALFAALATTAVAQEQGSGQGQEVWTKLHDLDPVGNTHDFKYVGVIKNTEYHYVINLFGTFKVTGASGSPANDAPWSLRVSSLCDNTLNCGTYEESGWKSGEWKVYTVVELEYQNGTETWRHNPSAMSYSRSLTYVLPLRAWIDFSPVGE